MKKRLLRLCIVKKLITILASAIAAGGLSAFAQDWITVEDSAGNDVVWDNFSANHGEVAGLDDVNIKVLWATNGAADLLGSCTPTNGFSEGVTGAADINIMLESGWTLAQNYNSGGGTAALGTVETTTGGTTGGKGGSVVAYNLGNSFELSTTATGDSGSTIELLYIAFNGSASSYSTAEAIGWTSMYEEPIGLTATDPNADITQTFGPLNANAFGVDEVPEPATVALTGLGGLSMLLVRRLKS